jgi:hypothetical protein
VGSSGNTWFSTGSSNGGSLRLEDPELLGGVLGGDTWRPWRVILTAAMGEALSDDEIEIFTKFTGRKLPPKSRVDELWCAVGRRGGKSRAMAALAVYLAALNEHELARGEKGVVLAVAPDKRQARILVDYAEGCLQSTPLLKQLLANRTAEILNFKNGTSLEVRSASFRRIRGMTLIACLADEVAFWRSEDSTNPDAEILQAVRPGLATTKGPLVCISSPYARRGELWNAYNRHYGPDGDPAILVCRGASREFNASLPQAIVDRATERDAAAAAAEYLAEFRSDIEGFVASEVLDKCIAAGTHERPPLRAQSYVGFCDPSGGSKDSMTLGIAHTEGSTQVLDVLRERKPPFSPEAVVAEYAHLLRQYRCSKVYGDRFGGEWVAEAFRKEGVFYEASAFTKSALYQDLLPLLNSGAADLLENDRMRTQLLALERRTSRGGKDVIDHGPGGHDDVASAVAGALVTAFREPTYSAAQRRADDRKLAAADREFNRSII